MLNLQLLTGPIVEPITLAQAKQQLRLDAGFTDDDTLISGLITAAREIAENYCRRAFFNQTWLYAMDTFPWWNFASGTINPSMRKGWPFYSSYWDPLAIRLPKPRALAIQSIAYRDLSNTLQTLDPSTYSVDPVSEPARIVPMPSLTWPSTQLYLPGSVQVTYVSGSYVTQVSGESVTVPSAAPFTVALSRSPLAGVLSVLDSTGSKFAGWSLPGGALTFPSASAGLVYTVNYSIANAPQSLLAALLLIVAHLYENRLPITSPLTEMPWGIGMLLDQHRFEQFTYENGN